MQMRAPVCGRRNREYSCGDQQKRASPRTSYYVCTTSKLAFFPRFPLPSTLTWDHKLFSKCVQVWCERTQVVPAPLFPLHASLFALLLLNMPLSSPSLINPGPIGAVKAPVTSASHDCYKYRPGETRNPLVHPQTLTIINISCVFVRNFISFFNFDLRCWRW